MINIPIDPARLASYCRGRHITRLSLFGSVLREDFDTSSDVDVLVRFAEDTPVSLFDFVTVADELSELLGREVDLADESGLVESEAPLVRESILGTAVPVYISA
ncbi:MAG: nucleotidyltransferase domain-containing protein [Acidobacteria bacterium]|nr:nucleotidyltransferase domain-containing protein [Acidobacteriota bacterium]